MEKQTDELSKYYTRAMNHVSYDDLTEKCSTAIERLRALDWLVQRLKEGER